MWEKSDQWDNEIIVVNKTMYAYLNIIGANRENIFLILITDVCWHKLNTIDLGISGLNASWFRCVILCDLLPFISQFPHGDYHNFLWLITLGVTIKRYQILHKNKIIIKTINSLNDNFSLNIKIKNYLEFASFRWNPKA